MSMNIYLGAGAVPMAVGTSDQQVPDLPQVFRTQRRGLCKTFVFLDMREDSIDMGNFATYMGGGRTGRTSTPSGISLATTTLGLRILVCGWPLRNPALARPRTMPPLVANGLIPDVFPPRTP